MNHLPMSLSGHLGPGRFLRIAAGQPVRVCSNSGALWITVDGEPDDIQVDPGACLRMDPRSPMLVTALDGDADVTVTPLAPPGWRRRLAQAFGRPPISLRAA